MNIIAQMISYAAASLSLSIHNLQARRIYTIGAGRSGLVASACAMRLMHLRFETYAIGETILPHFLNERMEERFFIVFSGSGNTGGIVRITETVNVRGYRISFHEDNIFETK